jgi:hypothetical protein
VGIPASNVIRRLCEGDECASQRSALQPCVQRRWGGLQGDTARHLYFCVQKNLRFGDP